jgi:tRNA threonylcarbamoyladenosine biosynthesis protein TsaB
MSLILHIDTAITKAYLSIAKDGHVLAQMENDTQKDHAAFLQVAIQAMTKKIGVALQDLDAIAVAAGPGSYTGLRVGMASAKGLCYALAKPLITIGNLQLLTRQALYQLGDIAIAHNYLMCPMIDARRMEVYTALFTATEKMIVAPRSTILLHGIMDDIMLQQPVVFFGNGAAKWSQLCMPSTAAIFITVEDTYTAMAQVALAHFSANNFANVALETPFYLKDFFTHQTV